MIVNGPTGNSFQLEREIRQRDPISPYALLRVRNILEDKFILYQTMNDQA